MNDFQEMWNHLKIIGSEATIILNLRPTRRSVFKTLAGHKKSQLKIESVRKFEKGNKIVWFSSYGSNVQSSRTANSKRATTRNVETVPIPHRPSERRSVPGGGGGEVKNDLRWKGEGQMYQRSFSNSVSNGRWWKSSVSQPSDRIIRVFDRYFVLIYG